MIAEFVQEITDNDAHSITITYKIKDVDNWKFRRWIDLMNAFDDMRESSYTFNTLLKEITEDYDKDEQSKSDVGYI